MDDVSGRRQYDVTKKVLEDRFLLADTTLVQHTECPWVDMRLKDLAHQRLSHGEGILKVARHCSG